MNILHSIQAAVGILPLPPFNDFVRGLALLIALVSVSYMAINQVNVPEYYLLFTATYNGYYFGHQQAKREYSTRKGDMK